MKRQARPAAMEDADSETGEAIPNTRTDASIFSQTKEPTSPKSSSKRKRKASTLDNMQSVYKGPIVDIVTETFDGLLTILAGEHDDNHLVWRQSGKHRVFFCPDKVVNGETKTYVNREISISKADLDRPNPELLIGQRVYNTFGAIELKANQLLFGPSIVLNKPYVFLRLGDEIPGAGCPDLHCTFRLVEDWESVARRADTSRFDQNVTVNVSHADVQADRKITYDLQNKKLAAPSVKPALGIEVSAAELFPRPHSPPTASFSSPKRRMTRSLAENEGIRVSSGEQRSVVVKLIGVGDKIGDAELKADVNIEFVLTG
ncbi:hypothetical protein DL98DRAFT_587589 [Cadophora sp. DSE1049]|nr:hypothetical protein DL98DRAFT_587589 [Cadophora sp. DSE1049]